MNKIFWWIFGIIGGLAGIACLVFMFLIFQEMKGEEAVSEENAHVEQPDKEEPVKTQAADKATDNFVNPFGEATRVAELTSSHYNKYIHGMSHQKVEADEKWGFYEMTEERIKWLLNALDEIDVNHEETYRDILERWSKGDFSQVASDHNQIWRLQGGTIGRATGKLSAEEEQEYLESQK